MSDNGSQFHCNEFRQFSKKYAFKHVTSSPGYPQSNGQVEKAVNTWKSITDEEGRADKKDVYLVILDWRNIPTEGLQTSPAQRLMGRRTKTFLSAHPSLLEPTGGTAETQAALRQAKVKQARYFNKSVKALQELKPDDMYASTSREHLVKTESFEESWHTLYKVEVDGRIYRRNRRQLRATCEHPDPEPAPFNHQRSVPDPESPSGPSARDPPVLDPPVANVEAPSSVLYEDHSQSKPPKPGRKSERNTRLPVKLRDFVIC